MGKKGGEEAGDEAGVNEAGDGVGISEAGDRDVATKCVSTNLCTLYGVTVNDDYGLEKHITKTHFILGGGDSK